MVLALLLQHARVKAGDRVLIVGAASGYSAAVVSHMGANATALENDANLVGMANAAGVDTVVGPLANGWPAGAPYDLVLFEGAIELVPSAITAQLASGGRIAAVIREGGVGRAYAGLLVASAHIGGQSFLEVAARPLPGFAAKPGFVF
jgi:protein-L-isoaspartate(D-aspartate) O-methyltransferase